MRKTVQIVQIVLRAAGATVLVLDLLFRTGNFLALIPIHMLAGLLVVLSLWTLAGLAARAGVGICRVALAVVWGLIVPVLGVTQSGLLPGDLHWIVQLLHLLIGIGALGQGEGLAARIKRAPVLARQS